MLKHNYIVEKIEHLNGDSFILQVNRNNLEIKAGQCFSLGQPGTAVNREYSIYSGEKDEQLMFLIKKVEDGIVSQSLSELKKDDKIELSGPFGEFCIDKENLNKKFLFICTGTGIAPFVSFTKTYDLNYKIIHGVRKNDERFDHQEILNDKEYIPCVSREEGTEFKRVTDYIKNTSISEDTFIYLCGNRSMIVDVVELLNTKGNYENIYMEVFF